MICSCQRVHRPVGGGNEASVCRILSYGCTRGASSQPSVGPGSPDRSAQLLDTDQVARGVAEGAVAHPVRLLDRLLDDLGVAGLQPLEDAVEVVGGQQDPAVG